MPKTKELPPDSAGLGDLVTKQVQERLMARAAGFMAIAADLLDAAHLCDPKDKLAEQVGCMVRMGLERLPGGAASSH